MIADSRQNITDAKSAINVIITTLETTLATNITNFPKLSNKQSIIEQIFAKQKHKQL
jgi:hypothetical protein